MDRPRLGFLAELPPFGISTEGVARISSRPTDSADSSLGASNEAVDDTRGIILTEQRRSVNCDREILENMNISEMLNKSYIPIPCGVCISARTSSNCLELHNGVSTSYVLLNNV